MTRLSHSGDIPFDQLVQIFHLNNQESSKNRQSAAGKSGGAHQQKWLNAAGFEGRGSSSRGSSCFGLGSWGSSSKATLSSFSSGSNSKARSSISSGVSKSTLFQSRSGTPVSVAPEVENAGDECGPPSPADPSSLRGGQAKKDACAPAPSVFLVARSEGPDRLTPLQQVKKAISNAFFVRIGNWGSEPCRRVQSFDTPQPAKAPPEQDKASISNPLDSQIPSSPGTGSRTPIRQLKPGLSRSANARMPSTDSMERGVQHLPLKSCFSRSMDRTLVKHVSFSLDGAAEVLGEGPGETSSCARTSDCRPSSTFPSEDTPSCSSGPRSSNPPPASPENSAKSGSTRSRSSADTFFFQGILGRSRRGSKSDESLPTLEHSEAGDGDAAQEEKPRVAGRKGSLEFYQFAKPFDLGLEGEDGLQLYACSPTGDEGDAAIVDHAGCVVRRVKAGRRKRRNGYMLEAELAVRCFAIDGMEGTESWPVQLANAIVAIPLPFHQRAKSAEDLCLLSHL